MASIVEPETTATEEHGQHGHGHPEFLAHHFETPQQQYDSGKLGMWLFLVNEVLFFSGLFVAYAIYRSNHPEIFIYAHQFLDKNLGAFNTLVLLFSSLTMAWAVRHAQLSNNRGLIACLAITIGCAIMFLGVKAVEYSHKWDIGLFWASRFAPTDEHPENSNTLLWLCVPFIVITVVLTAITVISKLRQYEHGVRFFGILALASAMFFVGVGSGIVVPAVMGSHDSHATAHADSQEHADAAPTDTEHGETAHAAADEEMPRNAGIFFSIYYVITGLHAVHIFAGIIALSWLLWRALKRRFQAEYFGPVDNVGLYWHLVDLVWIYLFPLLYLIH